MRRVRLVALAALTISAFAASGAAVAGAEDKGPAFLLLESSKEGFEAKLKGSFKLVSLAGTTITTTGVEFGIENCEVMPNTEEKDISLCKDSRLNLTGVKSGALKCRSEAGMGGDQDPAEFVLALMDLHLAAESSATEKLLKPLLLAKVLGPLLEEELTIKCGAVQDKVKGTFACLILPGLENIPVAKEFEIACAISAGNDPVTGTCELLCEWLTSSPFLANLGKGFEDAWVETSYKGKFTKDVFIDD